MNLTDIVNLTGRVEESDSTPKTAAETAQINIARSKAGNLAARLKVVGGETDSAGQNNDCRSASCFLPIIGLQAARSENLELLADAVKHCYRGKIATAIPAVTAQMHRLNPAFDYGWAGFPTIFNLVISAADMKLIDVWKQNRSFILLPSKSTVSSNRKLSAEFLRNHLQNLLRCRLTESSIRGKICETAFDIIFDGEESGGIILSKLSVKVARTLFAGSHSVPSSEIYNYLYSLFRGHCFTFEESDFDYYNPVITGFKICPAEWDSRFVTVHKIQFEQTCF